MTTINWVNELSAIPEQWALTPVKDKRPLRPSWQSEQPIDRATLAMLLTEGQQLPTSKGTHWHCRWTGIGLRLGEISGGLLAIDIDGELAQQKFFELQGNDTFPSTVSWTSGKEYRRQILYQVPTEYHNLICRHVESCGKDRQDLDFRWDGAQSVLPPSIHPETGRYQWINSIADSPVETVPEWVIDFLSRKLTESTPPTTASLIRESSILDAPPTHAPLPSYRSNNDNHWGDTEFALSYLAQLSPWRADDYHSWLAVGMALHSTGDDSLLSDWDKWSSTSPKYKQGECERKWQKFKHDGRITLGTLGQYAKEDGWTSPFPKRDSYDTDYSSGGGSGTNFRPMPNNAPSVPVMESENEIHNPLINSDHYRRVEKSLYRSLPPHLLEAEIELLGLLLLDLCNPLDVLGTIASPDIFYDKRHRIIYKAMLDLEQQKLPTSLVPVLDRLNATGELDQIGGKQFLIDITDSQHNSLRGSRVEQAAKLLVDKWIRRKLIEVASKVSVLGHEQVTPLDEILDEGERLVYGIRNLQPSKETKHNSEVSYDAYSLLSNPGNIYQTGFHALDARLIGLEPETLTVLAARSSMGKTAVALQLLLQFTHLHGKHCAYFSLEMTAKQLEFRIWTMLSQHPYFKDQGFTPLTGNRIKQHLSGTNPLTQDEAENISRIASFATGLNFSINDSRNITPSGIGSECRKLKSQHGNELGLIVIDYLQLFGEGKGDASERSNILLNVTRYFYNLAQELNCPVVLLAQVNRGPEARDNKRPSMSDLAQSGGIEWIADTVLLLYRESYYKPDADDTLEIICAKVRQGETGVCKLGYDLPNQIIYDITESFL